MKTIFVLSAFMFLSFYSSCQEEGKIRLLVRGDDIGSFHAANLGCIQSYNEGIMRSTEIMVPCAWYPEAVKMLNKNQGLDVGIHLVLTSEWENMKWRPLTGFSSITDESGYFFPMVWPKEDYPPERTFRESGWKIEDVEKELRAQIEVALKDIENISHITTHMGFTSADPAIERLVVSLAREYDLYYESASAKIPRLGFKREKSADFESQEIAFANALCELEPGTYLFVEHPALNLPEMESIGHKSYQGVGYDREGVTRIFISPIVKQVIKEKGIELISYGDLKR